MAEALKHLLYESYIYRWCTDHTNQLVRTPCKHILASPNHVPSWSCGDDDRRQGMKAAFRKQLHVTTDITRKYAVLFKLSSLFPEFIMIRRSCNRYSMLDPSHTAVIWMTFDLCSPHTSLRSSYGVQYLPVTPISMNISIVKPTWCDVYSVY
jgi:hypothetical protein